jgi:hypothetical protein
MSGMRRREFIVLSSAARLRAAKAFVQQLRRLCEAFIKRVRENVDDPPNPPYGSRCSYPIGCRRHSGT